MGWGWGGWGVGGGGGGGVGVIGDGFVRSIVQRKFCHGNKMLYHGLCPTPI